MKKLILILVLILTYQGFGATTVSQDYYLPVKYEYYTANGGTITDPNDLYAILFDTDTARMAISPALATSDPNYTAGATSADYTWAQCYIEGNLCSSASVGEQNPFMVKFTFPALNTDIDWGVGFFESTSPSSSDYCEIGPLYYDPVANETYTSLTPLKDQKVHVKVGPE